MELVVIQNRNVVTSTKIIAEVFGKAHRNVLRDVDTLKKDMLNFERIFFEGEEPDSYGRPQRVYYMNRDGFSLLAMGFTGKEALQFKLKYIEAFNKMEENLHQLQLPSYQIDDPVERAKKWIEEQQQTKLLAATIEEQKPKVTFADAVSDSDGLVSVKDLAVIITQNGHKIGRNNLFNWLRLNGYIEKRSTKPLQRFVEQGLFKVTESIYKKPDGNDVITVTTKVTGKGQQYFVNKFLGK